MKKLLIYASALLFTIGTTAISCDGESDLLDITTSTEFERTFVFNSQGDETADVEETKILDPSDNSGYEKVKDKIKEIEIEKITYTFTKENVGNNSDANFTVAFAFADSETKTLAALETISVDFSKVGEEITLDVSQDSLNKLKEYFENGTKMELYADGVLIDGPVNVDCLLKIYTKITASAG